MKKVSFKVAKTIKDAGYPQSEYKNLISSYFTGIHRYTRDDTYCSIELENEFIEPIDWIDSYNYEDHDFDGDFIDAPTYLEAWLWLWRNKRIAIELYTDLKNSWFFSIGSYVETKSIEDPEESIIAAIDYLVDNDLIK